MGTIFDEARAYEPKTTKNVVDLEIVETNIEVKDGKGQDSDGKEFVYKFIEVNGEEYRIPFTVLKSLKAILEIKPDLKTFRVTKTGVGLETRYTVIPL